MPRCFVQIPGGRIKQFSDKFSDEFRYWHPAKGWEPTPREMRSQIALREINTPEVTIDDDQPDMAVCVSCGPLFDLVEQWAAAPGHLYVLVNDENQPDDYDDREVVEDGLMEPIKPEEEYVFGADGRDECPHGHGYLDHGVCRDCGYDRNQAMDMAECACMMQREIARLHARAYKGFTT